MKQVFYLFNSTYILILVFAIVDIPHPPILSGEGQTAVGNLSRTRGTCYQLGNTAFQYSEVDARLQQCAGEIDITVPLSDDKRVDYYL